MRSQLYLWKELRELKQQQIKLYIDTYEKRISPVFSNIEKEAEDLQNSYYEKMMNAPCYDEGSFIDPSDIAETAFEKGLEHYESISLMKYNNLAMWICMLYEYWEQQVRYFLYDEENHYFNIDFKEFCCKGINDLKQEFLFHKVDMDKLKSWDKINELRLICNVIKHGDGKSASDLKLIKPQLFVREGLEHIDMLELYKVTLLDEVLNINIDMIRDYGENLVLFWGELPDRMYSDEL